MSTSFNNSPAIAFESRWSTQRLLVTSVQYLLCLTWPWLLSVTSIPTKILLSAAAIGGLSVAFLQVGWWGRRRVTRITWQQSGEWLLTRSSQQGSAPWLLQASSLVTPWLMVLRWRRDGDSAAVMVFYGEMTAVEWRRWQARLRLQGHGGTSVQGHLQ